MSNFERLWRLSERSVGLEFENVSRSARDLSEAYTSTVHLGWSSMIARSPAMPTRRQGRWNNVAVLSVGTPCYAKDLSFCLEIGLAFLDGRSTASWLIEQEDLWRPAQSPSVQGNQATLGAGLNGAIVAEELRSATIGYRLYSKDYVEANQLLGRLAAACELDLGFKVRDFWSLLIPSDPRRDAVPRDDVLWAEHWSHCSVPETPRTVVLAARDVAFLRELRRLASKS